MSSSSTDGPRVWSVGQVARSIAGLLAREAPMLWVRGEVTNMRRARRSVYLTLKDRDTDAKIDAFVPLWQTDVSVELVDGMMVRMLGKPEYFAPSAALRLYAYEVAADGEGELLARIEALRQRLEREGLFRAERKRPIPFIPRRVGLITAKDGAARHDVEQTIANRFPGTDLLIVTALMQGAGSPTEVVRALAYLDREPSVDVIVIARGGGSLEDLMAFNDERVARAIAACTTPTVAAIGHEPDVTIACRVADLRVPTPTAAATAVVPDAAALRRELGQARRRAADASARLVAAAARDLAATRARPALARPSEVLAAADRETRALRNRLRRGLLSVRDGAAVRIERDRTLLAHAARARAGTAQAALDGRRDALRRVSAAPVDRASRELELLGQRLAGRDPTRPLREGYALVTGSDGAVATSARAAAQARHVRLRFADGAVAADVRGSVEEVTPG